MSNYLADKTTAPAPAGPTQIDGNVIAQREKPTKAPLQDRHASPMHGRSGMEQAMGTLADQLHKPTRRR